MNSSEKRFPALDGWRGVAILLVLVYHFVEFQPQNAWEKILFRFTSAGWSGVDLFFVLSGFLITGILLDTREAPHYFRSFYLRRLLRIQPIYLVLMTTLIVLLRFTPLFGESIQAVPTAAVYLLISNWTVLWFAQPMIIGMTWSLCIEEHFYLAWPLLVKRLKTRGLVFAACGVIVGNLCVRMAADRLGASSYFFAFNTLTRSDGLAIGALLAIAFRSRTAWRLWTRNVRWALLAAVVGLAAIIVSRHGQLNAGYRSTQMIGFTLLALFWVAILTDAIQPSSENALAFRVGVNPVLQFFGKYSYSIYLIHPAVLASMERSVWLHFTQSGSALFRLLLIPAIDTAITVAVAMLCWHAIEKHALRLKRHFKPWDPVQPEESQFAHAGDIKLNRVPRPH